MFKIECGVPLGYASSTAQQCTWNQTFHQKVSSGIQHTHTHTHTMYTLYYIHHFTKSCNDFSNDFLVQIEPATIAAISFE